MSNTCKRRSRIGSHPASSKITTLGPVQVQVGRMCAGVILREEKSLPQISLQQKTHTTASLASPAMQGSLSLSAGSSCRENRSVPVAAVPPLKR